MLTPSEIAKHAPFLPGRNKIINGSFDIWQRKTSSSSTEIVADRWNVAQTETSVFQRSALGTDAASFEPVRQNYSGNFNITVAGDSATGQSSLYQWIENVRHFAGRRLTVSFDMWLAGAVDKTIGVEIYRNYGTGGSAAESIEVKTVPITAGGNWQRYSISFDVPDLAGKTVDAADSCFAILFWFSAGTSFLSRAGIGQQLGDFYITEIQAEEGEMSEYEHRSVADELALCQRYYHRLDAQLSGQCYATTNALIAYTFPTPMRTTPTVGNVTLGELTNVGASTIAVTGHSGGVIRPGGAYWLTTVASGLVAGDATVLVGAVRSFDAEL